VSVQQQQIARDKADRALALQKQGLSRAQIAERLGMNAQDLSNMLQRAKMRAERAAKLGEADK
jgi:lambda repressor-like predicted transcriptional regulator